MGKVKDQQINNSFSQIDGAIKFALAAGVATIAFFIYDPWSIAAIVTYLMLVTIFSKVRLKTLLLSAASYLVIVMIPYLFGYFMSEMLFLMSGNEMFIPTNQGYDVFIRLFRLFVVWYVSIIYFHTTSIEIVLSLLDKLLSPLKLLKVPVDDYLKIIMCIVIDLKGKGSEFRDGVTEDAKQLIGGKDKKLSERIRGVSKILVSLLVNSFEKINDVQKTIEDFDKSQLKTHKFKFSFNEIIAIFSFVIIAYVLYAIENQLYF